MSETCENRLGSELQTTVYYARQTHEISQLLPYLKEFPESSQEALKSIE